jgi:hypothetical protein
MRQASKIKSKLARIRQHRDKNCLARGYQEVIIGGKVKGVVRIEK